MTSITYTSDPSGAAVELDGEYVGTTPYNVEFKEPPSDFCITCLHNGEVVTQNFISSMGAYHRLGERFSLYSTLSIRGANGA